MPLVIEKKCENCRFTGTCTKADCHKTTYFYGWKPNYETLERQIKQLENKLEEK
jgi:hypothetical protein